MTLNETHIEADFNLAAVTLDACPCVSVSVHSHAVWLPSSKSLYTAQLLPDYTIFSRRSGAREVLGSPDMSLITSDAIPRPLYV